MNQNQLNGFIKRAAQCGIDQPAALQLLQKYADEAAVINGLLANMGVGGLAGAGLGGLAGGGIGYLTGRDDDPEKDHSGRNALLGAMAGAGLGGVGGAYYGGDQGVKQMAGAFAAPIEKDVAMLKANPPGMMSRGLSHIYDAVGAGKYSPVTMHNQGIQQGEEAVKQLKEMSLWKLLQDPGFRKSLTGGM